MKAGFIGLGHLGKAIAKRLIEGSDLITKGLYVGKRLEVTIG